MIYSVPLLQPWGVPVCQEVDNLMRVCSLLMRLALKQRHHHHRQSSQLRREVAALEGGGSDAAEVSEAAAEARAEAVEPWERDEEEAAAVVELARKAVAEDSKNPEKQPASSVSSLTRGEQQPASTVE